MKRTIYLIAQDFQVWDENHEPSIETRVSHNLGAWKKQQAAQKVCDEHNAELSDDDEGILAEYFVQPVELH